jgi:dihydrodiol dehydrogenase / D-xylose 1-dehydrogenase (NADP)
MGLLKKISLQFTGKHVLCEKPLGMNVKETREIIELAKAKKVFLMEAMWARLQPAQLQLREELERGTIGKIFHAPFIIRASNNSKSFAGEVKQSLVTMGFLLEAGRVNKKELGGGTVIDLGVYTVYFSQLVMGQERPEKIVATGHLNEDGEESKKDLFNSNL